MPADPTTDPERRSWVEVSPDSDFPIQNLPYGVVAPAGRPARVGVAIGDRVLDLAACADHGLLDGTVDDPRGVFASGSLNLFLSLGRDAWRRTRERVSTLLSTDDTTIRDRGLVDGVLLRPDDVVLHLPFQAGDYVDFYSSREHATNLGRMFRPESEPLLPNWRHLPVGYHGRSSTIVVSGTDVRRPTGQTRPGDDGVPGFGPSRRLDIELEVGFVTGPGNALGEAIAADDAADHIFGLVLVNDWSARDIQAWEYVPLGPFLGKSFATSVSPWVVPLDALAPYRVPGPEQEPQPLPYLRTTGDWGLDLQLEVWLETGGGDGPQRVSATNFRHMYWSMAQQLAHATVNGTAVRPGDLYASGTVSGPEPGTYGSLIELSWNGERPLELPGGVTRTFLEDGDTATLRGWCGGDGRPRVGFGSCTGSVVAAR